MAFPLSPRRGRGLFFVAGRLSKDRAVEHRSIGHTCYSGIFAFSLLIAPP
jgi:hypothetical protein